VRVKAARFIDSIGSLTAEVRTIGELESSAATFDIRGESYVVTNLLRPLAG
jgi:hypothetical protein